MADGVVGLEPVAFWYVVLLGACLGSFVGVLIARLPEERSIVRPASACPKCGRSIAWYDNIPILSYLVLRGRCRSCKAHIAVRYLVVEALMAALAAALFVRFGLSWDLVIWVPLAAALIAITYLDIDHWWVPDVITFPAMAFVAAASLLPGGVTPSDALFGLLPAAFVLAVAWSFERIAKRPGLGLGDVKLLALLGLALGPMRGLTVLLLAAVQGSVVGSVVMFTGGHRGVGEPDPASNDAGATGCAELGDAAPGGSAAAATRGQQTDPGDGQDRSDALAKPVASAEEGPGAAGAPADDSDWVPPPRAIPFGPFLALAALEVVLLPHVFDNLHQRFAGIVARLLG